MYIKSKRKQIPCTVRTGGGGWLFCGEGVEDMESVFQLCADDGVLLREFDPEEWLRTVRGEGSLTLTNMPEVETVPVEVQTAPEDANMQAIAELSILQAAYQAQTDRALAEVSILLAGGGAADAV